MIYQVALTATAYVTADTTVEANSLTEAKQAALDAAWRGNVTWRYDGAEDDTAQVERIAENE